MPKTTTKKYGGTLDKYMEYIPTPGGLANEEIWKNYYKKIEGRKLLVLLELIDFYKIDFNSPSAWMQLSLRLAEDHVKAMKMPQKTSSEKWDWQSHLQLYALVQIEERNGTPLKLIPEKAQKSGLSHLIKKTTSPKTISNEISKFKKSIRGQATIKLIEHIPAKEDKYKFYEDVITGKIFIPE